MFLKRGFYRVPCHKYFYDVFKLNFETPMSSLTNYCTSKIVDVRQTLDIRAFIMSTRGRRPRGRLRQAAPIESPIAQEDTSIPETSYREDSSASSSGGYDMGDDSLSHAMLRVL